MHGLDKVGCSLTCVPVVLLDWLWGNPESKVCFG